MSDLHKLFLKRAKQAEASLGLSSLSEEGDDLPSPLPATINFPKQTTRKRDETNHFLIHKTYENARSSFTQCQFTRGDITFEVYYQPPEVEGITYVLNHGAGSSSMTFSMMAPRLPSVLLYDMRGHGQSTTSRPPDYSLDTLTDDFQFVLKQAREKWGIKDVVLVGHSLGGAVLTNYLVKNEDNQVKGLAMIDIVEETAVHSLSAMTGYIDKLPSSFVTYDDAIQWHKKMGLLHNTFSAQISIPDLFFDRNGKLYWKMNLRDTSPFWETWFKDLSSNFVTCGENVGKLLILAGHESLDKDLMIGQMQGKFQLVVLHGGHFLQEDVPVGVAATLTDFGSKIQDPEGYMKRELGVIPKWGGKINK